MHKTQFRVVNKRKRKKSDLEIEISEIPIIEKCDHLDVQINESKLKLNQILERFREEIQKKFKKQDFSRLDLIARFNNEIERYKIKRNHELEILKINIQDKWRD